MRGAGGGNRRGREHGGQVAAGARARGGGGGMHVNLVVLRFLYFLNVCDWFL
jgi:hypothetical protein